VTIAVLDSGVRADNPDLEGSIDLERSISVIDADQTNITDTYGHGTAVIGQLVAQTNNAYGVAARLPISETVVSIKMYGKNGAVINYSDLHAALVYLNTISNTVALANISMEGNPFPSPLINRINALITDMALTEKVIFIASAGNQGVGEIAYPANHPYVLAAGASTEAGERAFFSNYGSQLDILAPGTNIVVLSTQYQTEIRHGTSSAAPHVTAAVAIIKALIPEASFAEVLEILQYSAGEPWSAERGFGIINYTRLLDKLGVPLVPTPTLFPTSIPPVTATHTVPPTPMPLEQSQVFLPLTQR
jgi:subtilisin family serine protease